MHLILQGLAQTAVGGKEGFVAVNPAFNNFSDANNRIVVHVLAQAATQLVAEGLLVTSLQILSGDSAILANMEEVPMTLL